MKFGTSRPFKGQILNEETEGEAFLAFLIHPANSSRSNQSHLYLRGGVR